MKYLIYIFVLVSTLTKVPEEPIYMSDVDNYPIGEVTALMYANQMPPSTKAFSGAEGFGKYTTGGRGGTVYHVTNLNDDGSGSLRYGVETLEGPRTIVFDIAGYINLIKPLKVREGYGNLTIAGQTAPGDGIALRGASIWIHDGNIIIRYIKVRPGKDAYNPDSSGQDGGDEPDDGIRITSWPGHSIENIIIDHVSVTWAHDGLIDIGAPNSDFSTYTKNITIQNCIIAENIDKFYGVLIQRAYDVSFFRNLIAFTLDRNIAIQSAEGKGVEMVNNLVYGTERASWFIRGTRNDFIGNRFISGPLSRDFETFRMEYGPFDYDINETSIFLNDNFDDGVSADNNINETASPYKSSARHYNNQLPIMQSSSLQNSLIGNVGDNLHYDSVDLRIFDQINNNSGGIINDETLVGGYPQLNSVEWPESYDTDRDGMADDWETLHGVDDPEGITTNWTINGVDWVNHPTEPWTNLEVYWADLAGDWSALNAETVVVPSPSTPSTTKKKKYIPWW